MVSSQPHGAGAILFQQTFNAIAGTAGLLAGTSRKSIQALVQTANQDYAKLHSQIVCCFDAYMDNVSGVYKHRSHVIATIIAIAVVAILNVDTLNVYRGLLTQPTYQAAIAQKANVFVHQSNLAANANAGLRDIFRSLDSSVANLPVPCGGTSLKTGSARCEKVSAC